MRTSLLALSLALLTTTVFAENKEIEIRAEGKEAFKLSVEKDAKITVKGEKTTIQAPHHQIYVWQVPGAKSVDAVVARAGEVIKSEFVKYAVKSNDAIKVVGHEARHLKGTGEEADDNDPGTAEVVIFAEGQNVFAACVHGERDEAARQRPELLKVLGTIKAP